ncbi:hypothetical protein [Synechococcus sp. MU1642]|uniref:hypothetical protein n=1 Tax=Synechococcus sp. MU1642 TaxID=2508348 RepID=UPI001CF82129|nr:hypothetical protein [Synechococcus sp. MU1642]MCB4406488.1 hypothetical protein [Synechococcus sp. MU1642]
MTRDAKKASPYRLSQPSPITNPYDSSSFKRDPIAETLRLPYSVQGNGTVESIGNHLYRVCRPAVCTAVMGLSNALYLSRNVPEVEHKHRSNR